VLEDLKDSRIKSAWAASDLLRRQHVERAQDRLGENVRMATGPDVDWQSGASKALVLFDLAALLMGEFVTVNGHAVTYFWDMAMVFEELQNKGQ
jgi:hypothetical protein